MIQELYCKNFKIFRKATTFPLRRLTVVTGPNNSGKSTIFDLVRLIGAEDHDENGNGRILYSLNLNVDNRIRTFQELLGDSDEALEVGIQGFAPIEIDNLSCKDKSKSQEVYHNFRLDDNIQIRSRFEAVGEDYFLSDREVSLCPPDASDPQRVFHEWSNLHGTSEDEPESESTQSQKNNNGDSQPSTQTDSRPTPPPPPAFLKVKFGLGEGKDVIRDNRGRSGDDDRILALRSEGASMTMVEDYKLNREMTWTIHEALMEVAAGVLNRYSELSQEDEYSFSKKDVDLLTQRPSSVSPSLPSFIQDDKQDEFPERSFYPFFGADNASKIRKRGRSPSWLPKDKKELWYDAVEKVIGPLLEKVDTRLSEEILYVPPFRGRPKRHYGPGDALTPLLESFQEVEKSKVERVEKWLHTFEIGSHLHVESVGPDLYEAYVERGDEVRYLADLGSGSAQLIPLFINLVTRQSQLILIEEPEANLHPNLQARLADFFVELIDRGIQVVVETHSEYLTRRLQYLVARGNCDPDHANVLYLRDAEESSAHSDSTPRVQEITIDEDGQLSQPFGPGFFDQSTNLMVDLFKYGSEN